MTVFLVTWYAGGEPESQRKIRRNLIQTVWRWQSLSSASALILTSSMNFQNDGSTAVEGLCILLIGWRRVRKKGITFKLPTSKAIRLKLLSFFEYVFGIEQFRDLSKLRTLLGSDLLEMWCQGKGRKEEDILWDLQGRLRLSPTSLQSHGSFSPIRQGPFSLATFEMDWYTRQGGVGYLRRSWDPIHPPEHLLRWA